jgi:hypothetical protein
MDLKPFNATHVNPGQPLTAQAWNDVVDAIDGAYQYLQATRHTVEVQVTNPELQQGGLLETVRVTAVRAGSAPVEAVRPTVPGGPHVISGLEPGAYTVQVEALGYTRQTVPVTVGSDADLKVTAALAPVGTFMPDLFGLSLHDAKAQLAQKQITLSRLLDCNGNDMAPSATDFDGTPVLVQSPMAGVYLPPGTPARLVVGVPQKVESGVEVPSLAGLTASEAQKALESIGLILGKNPILAKKPPTQ